MSLHSDPSSDSLDKVFYDGPANAERSYGGGGGVGMLLSGGGMNATQSSDGSNGAPSPGPVSPRPFPHSTSRSKLIVAPHNGHPEGGEGRHTVNGSTSTRDGGAWPSGRLYVNKDSLAHDLSFLANKPELCDVTFLVGEDRQPICAVRAILAARSRSFRKMLYGESTSAGGGAAASSKKQKKKQNFKPSDGYIEKYDFRGQPTIIVKEFEPEVFKQLIEYTHTGSVMLQARTLLGLMNAADHYGIEDLKQACIRFMEHCVTIDTVCSLLSSAEKYIQYKSTKIIVQKIFEFVDQNAETILSLGAFATLPQHVVRIVMGREDLQALETTKFEAALRWCYRYCDEQHGEVSLKEAFEPFVDVIDYYKIPAKLLMQRVKPEQVVDDSVILTALAYQADPKSIEHLRPTSMSVSNAALKTRRTTSPCPPEGFGKEFRRVQSSGIPLDMAVNPLSLKVSHGGRVRAVTPTPDVRSIRGNSVPAYDNEMMKRVRSQDALDDFWRDKTEHHPIKAHHVHGHGYGIGGRDRLDSHNSHGSLLSSPPLSPASPSTESYQESTVSTFSGSSIERDSYHNNMARHSPSPDESDTTPQASVNGQRKLAYNAQALDAIVTLSSTNAVEV